MQATKPNQSWIEGIRRPLQRGAVFAAAAGLLAACASQQLSHPTTVGRQDEAASVHVTAETPRPWSDVVGSLDPSFTMSGDAALLKVLPNVSNVQEAQLRSIGGSLAVGLPQTSRTSTAVTTQNLSGNTTTAGGADTVTGSSGAGETDTQTTTKGPGVVPMPPAAVAGVTAPALTVPTGALGQDPILAYQQANSLNQYVQLKNHEISGAVQRDCYVPYIVTLKLAVSVYRPRLAYAVNTRGSFFEARQDEPEKVDDDCRAYMGNVPIVVPILVTDDVLVSTRSRAQTAAQQIAAALSVMSHGVGGALGANWLNQQLQAIQSDDLSSSVTVTRLTDNTLYVRVAPSNESTGQPSLVGKTYDIDVVVLVPKPYFDSKPAALKLDTVTELRNVFDGTLLPIRPPAATLERFEGVMASLVTKYGLETKWAATTSLERAAAERHLVDLIQSSDQTTFMVAVRCPVTWNPMTKTCPSADDALLPDGFAGASRGFRESYGRKVWTALSVLIADQADKSVAVTLPTPKPIKIKGQSALALDDGKSASTVLVHDVSAANINGLTALLDLYPVDASGAASGHELQLAAAAVKYDPVSRNLTLTFPSPAAWGVTKIDETQSKLKFDIVGCEYRLTLCPALTVAGNERGDTPDQDALDDLALGARLLAAPKADGTPADFKSTPDVTEIEPKDHAGFASITLPDLPADETVSITATGASLTSVTDEKKSGLNVSQGAYTAPGKGLYILSFQNLKPDSQVVVTLQGMRGKTKVGSSTVTFHVAAGK